MNNFLIDLSCAFKPPSQTGYGTGRVLGDERVFQYVEGLKTFFTKDNPFFDEDVIISDNTCKDIDEIDERIRSNFPTNSKIFLTRDNNLGAKNNGVGLIHSWLSIKSTIRNYKWIIHHEPRMKMRNMTFLNTFRTRPRNLLTLGKETGTAFNTGLFCIESSVLLDYCESCNLVDMVNRKISIEDHMWQYFRFHNIPYDTVTEMGVTYFPHNISPIDM